MRERVLVAGATAGVGRRLVPLLVAEGYQVFGTTPGTGKTQPAADLPCHVDVAAAAALVAIEKGEPGIFSVVDWAPYLRL